MLDQMDDDRYRALRKQWRLSPPVAWLVAGFFRYKPPAEDEPPPLAAPGVSIAALKAALPNGRL